MASAYICVGGERKREIERERGAACTATEEEESVQDRQNCRREGVAMGNESRDWPFITHDFW